MLENRLTEWFAEVQAGSQAPFVAFPTPLVSTYTPAQLAFVTEVYQRARALLETQFQAPARPRPAFSMN